MVGINVRKEYLPHHTQGSKETAGDEYKHKSGLRTVSSLLYDRKNYYEGIGAYKRAYVTMVIAAGMKMVARKIYNDQAEGSWYGNETISKTILDLNKILMYADKEGKMKTVQQRSVLSIGDMIIAGEKEGPVMPSPKKIGVLVIGINSVQFDAVVGTMMGAQIDKIPQMNEYKNTISKKYMICDDISSTTIISNDMDINGKRIDEICNENKWKFIPTNGWRDVFGEL